MVLLTRLWLLLAYVELYISCCAVKVVELCILLLRVIVSVLELNRLLLLTRLVNVNVS